jgi:putative N6-adenine-specific DNA methylase
MPKGGESDGPGAEGLSDRALERRVKRWLLSGPFDGYVQTAPGLEPILMEELRATGIGSERVAERGGVALRLEASEIMRANLSLRTAGRVLLRLATFPAAHAEMLFDRVGKLPWEVHLGRAERYALSVTSRASRLPAGDGVVKVVARAVTRRMRALGLHPVVTGDAPLTFRIRLIDDVCTVSLDTSGEHLHRRGVRRHVHDAPVRETIAAAVALDAYRGHDTVLDPFCGSGTLLIEMADLAAGRLPGRARAFAFEAAAWHRPGRWREVQRAAATAAEERAAGGSERPRLIGMDLDADALDAARRNLAGSDHRHVELVRADATQLDLDGVGARRGLIVANLPYGVRLGDAAGAGEIVRGFLDRCGRAASSWDLALLTTHPRLVAEHPAVEVEATRVVASGGLLVTLVRGRTRSGAMGT